MYLATIMVLKLGLLPHFYLSPSKCYKECPAQISGQIFVRSPERVFPAGSHHCYTYRNWQGEGFVSQFRTGSLGLRGGSCDEAEML